MPDTAIEPIQDTNASSPRPMTQEEIDLTIANLLAATDELNRRRAAKGQQAESNQSEPISQPA